MTTRKALGTICLVALMSVLTQTAGAGTEPETVLKGKVEPRGSAKITISSGRSQGVEVRKYDWTFRGLEVICGGDPWVSSLPVKGGFIINAEFDPQPWGVSGTAAGDPDDPTYATEVSGRLVNKHWAKGWVRVFGSAVPVRNGETMSCDSGRLRWSARE